MNNYVNVQIELCPLFGKMKIFLGTLAPLPPMNPLDFMYAYMHKKRRETRK